VNLETLPAVPEPERPLEGTDAAMSAIVKIERSALAEAEPRFIVSTSAAMVWNFCPEGIVAISYMGI
jgi:hypothetical protein